MKHSNSYAPNPDIIPYQKASLEKPSSSSKINLVEIVSRIDANLEYFGKATGRRYSWNGAGKIEKVHPEDVPELLSKRLGKKLCCGNGTNQIFEIVGGTHA